MEMTHWVKKIVVQMGENPITNFDGGNSGEKFTIREWRQMRMKSIQ